MIKKRIFFVFVVFAVSILPIAAQTNKTATVRSIDAYVKTIDKFIGKKKPLMIFADTSDYNDDGKAKWRKFASEKALETFRTRNETYTIAYNWRKGGKLVQSNFTLFSPSGDWAQYDFHYFRANGSIAKIASEMRTFVGDLIILRDFYFDTKGKLIRQTTRYRDLTTEKPISKPKDIDFSGSDVKIYKTVRRLPFAKLIG